MPEAIILAGGLGSRLHPLTKTLPKPLIPLAGKPILQYIIDLLKANGFNR
ncbi:MAG: NTP transferase domain-containing protein, partial [Thermosphaera sp.]|nr:NTP transferase domain-containing protein [Thermosphaera sp.]